MGSEVNQRAFLRGAAAMPAPQSSGMGSELRRDWIAKYKVG